MGTSPALWQELYKRRWRHGAAQQWGEMLHGGRWHELYCRRAEVDAQAFRLLRQLQYPQRWYSTIQELHRLGFLNIKDLLIRIAADPQGGCGPRYWAVGAAEDLAGRQAAEEMAGLVAEGGDAGGARLDEGALLVAAVHSPLGDVSWVRMALDALGLELQRRLRDAGADPNSVAALEVLGGLLFGPVPPAGHPQASVIPAPPGYGMGLQGDRDSYYDPANSLVTEVLVTRQGIPISLAVVHAAVAARAGMEVEVLNVPMHVVTRFGAKDTDEERFIDVFDQGRIMTREEMAALLSELGLPGFDRRHLQPMPPARVFARMCYNLASIYSALGSGGDASALKMQKSVMRLLAALDSADTFSSRLELAKACAALGQYEEGLEIMEAMAEEGQAPPGSPTNARVLLQAHISRLSTAIAERDSEQAKRRERRGSASGVRFEVGQIIRHKRYEYRGVIIGWDPTCTASEDWIRQMGVDRLDRGRHQPFYNVLVDPQDRGGQQTYVAEENLGLEPLTPRQRSPGFEVHPDVGRYFEGLREDGAGYLPNDWLQQRYPEG